MEFVRRNGSALSLLIQIFTIFKTTRSHILEFDSILPINPDEYDNLQPPKENGEATVVRFHVTVLSIDTIDEGSMTYVADIFMSQSWKDYRLRLPENMTMKYRLLPVNWLKRMWRPDSFFKNAKRVTFQEMTIPNHYIWLYSDKTILYMVKLTLLLSCSMKFEAYPHDTQVCSMKIESLSYTTDDLIFDWETEVPLVVDDDIELPQHNLVDTSLGDCTKVYSTGNFTCIQVVFTLKRRLGYYMFHTYIPTCLIVIMSWISFWIKPEAVPARVTLCVTSLLTLSTQHAQSQKSLPPVSYIKAIDIFMSSCTVFVFASLMEYALVNILLGEGLDGYLDEDGNQTHSLFARNTPNILIVPRMQDLPNGRPKLTSTLYRHSVHRRRAILVDKVSRVIFPLSFVILNTIYWSFYLEII
ncbi:glycine receptor subunit alpha-2 [Parasteatoda tepidariorum]|uniref:glycine receptor subunit alpha-2 n=1 Tax=Parasteatoda tepidariorum TaxID=114398 RepID=UPI000A2BFC6D|nr:glycine receptor subunit alpha-3 [Parasteatoda tepidariorum]